MLRAKISAQWRWGSYHKTMKDTQQEIEHVLEKVPDEKNNQNEISRIEGAQRVMTGTNSVLL